MNITIEKVGKMYVLKDVNTGEVFGEYKTQREAIEAELKSVGKTLKKG